MEFLQEMEPASAGTFRRAFLEASSCLLGSLKMQYLAIIGGSQAYELLSRGLIRGRRIGPVATPFGPSSPVFDCTSGDARFLFLSRHGEQNYSITASFVNYRANIFALKKLGASRIVAWSGPGSITKDIKPGDFVVVDDLVDETRRRAFTFFENTGIGFVRQNPVFCPALRKTIIAVLKKLRLRHHARGTYVCTEGPRLETPAEIRKFATFRANLVGMTLAPEVFLSKELEMCYAAICYVSNWAEGIRKRTFRPGVLFEGLASATEMKKVQFSVERFPDIIHEIVSSLPEDSSGCSCQSYLKRYRDRGQIEEDVVKMLQRRSQLS